MSTAADLSADRWYRIAESIHKDLLAVAAETRAGRGVHSWSRQKRIRYASLCARLVAETTRIVDHVEGLHGPLPSPTPPRRVGIDWRGRKGARKPEGVVVVARPTRWGNPFAVEDHGRGRAVELFRAYAAERAAREPGWLDPLRGMDLACYCRPDEPCHGDVLIELANRD